MFTIQINKIFFRWGDCSVGTTSTCPVEEVEGEEGEEGGEEEEGEEEESTNLSCTTIGGPAANASCVFPFIVGDVTYTSCVETGKVNTSCSTVWLWGIKIVICKSEGLEEPWCSTATTKDGHHIAEEGNYGQCPEDCGKEIVEPGTCTTMGGPGANKTCVFPFTVGGVTYSECKTDGKVNISCTTDWKQGIETTSCKSEGLDEPWCSTATTEDGHHIAEQGNYGQCQEDCRECAVVSGPAEGSYCVFPFTWGNTSYTECAEWTYGGDMQGQFWCSTRYCSEYSKCG